MTMSLYAVMIGPFEGFNFMRIALVACLALALANGPIGFLLLSRRMALDGDVMSHAVMPGAALGFVYAGHSLFALSIGGFVSGAVVTGLAGLLAHGRNRRDDTGLVAFYLVTLALGVLLVSYFGSNVDVMRVLFGTVLAIDVRALLQIAAVSSLTMLLVAALYRPLAVDSFDRVFLRMVGGRGMRPMFMVLVLLNLVVSFQAFGTLLAVGPMLLPAAAARCWTLRPGATIVLASALGMISCYAGLLASYHANLPSGPGIVLASGIIYGLSLMAAAVGRAAGTMLKGTTT
jgi:zinc/manganese transport system permease protein